MFYNGHREIGLVLAINCFPEKVLSLPLKIIQKVFSLKSGRYKVAVVYHTECSSLQAAWHLKYSQMAWGTLRKYFTKPSEQVVAPDCGACSPRF